MMTNSDHFVCLNLKGIGQRFGQLRTMTAANLETMRRSLERYGQLSPVVIVEMDTGYEMVDGFKRQKAALKVDWITSLQCRVLMGTDAQGAKLAIYRLNQTSSKLNAIEEAWIVQSLHRDEQLSQREIAQQLGQHTTWVCRRLQLAEGLAKSVQEGIQAGLLSPTAGRVIVKLPRGNQRQLLDKILHQGLSTRELAQVVALYQKAKNETEQSSILSDPAKALKANIIQKDDERFSLETTRVLKKIQLLERLGTSVVLYLETHYQKASTDHAALRPWLQNLSKAIQLLNMRLEACL